LQGFLPLDPPPEPRSAILLQPKCVVVDVRELLALGPNGTSLRGPREPGEIGRGRTWVYEEYGVKQAREWLGHSDPATTLRHYVHLTTAARAGRFGRLFHVLAGQCYHRIRCA
jgi:hypothetical protein